MKKTELRSLVAELVMSVDKLPVSEEKGEICVLLGKLQEGLAAKYKPARLSEAEFLVMLKTLYPGLDLDWELKKMDRWLLVHPDKRKTQQFIINWLNKEMPKTTVGTPPARLPVSRPAPLPRPEGVPCPPEVAVKLKRLGLSF